MRETLIGTIVVGDGAVVRRELALLQWPGLSFAFDTFVYPDAHTAFCKGLYGNLLEPAQRLRDQGANLILVTCTTALMQCTPVEFADSLGAKVGLPVISVADAMVGLAASAGVRVLAIATPYGAHNNGIIRSFFEQAGFWVAAIEGLDLDRSLDTWQRSAQFLPDREIAALARAADRPEADAICLPSSGIASFAVAAGMQKLVVTAIGAGIWAVLQRSGPDDCPSYRDLLKSAQARDRP